MTLKCTVFVLTNYAGVLQMSFSKLFNDEDQQPEQKQQSEYWQPSWQQQEEQGPNAGGGSGGPAGRGNPKYSERPPASQNNMALNAVIKRIAEEFRKAPNPDEGQNRAEMIIALMKEKKIMSIHDINKLSDFVKKEHSRRMFALDDDNDLEDDFGPAAPVPSAPPFSESDEAAANSAAANAHRNAGGDSKALRIAKEFIDGFMSNVDGNTVENINFVIQRPELSFSERSQCYQHAADKALQQKETRHLSGLLSTSAIHESYKAEMQEAEQEAARPALRT